MDSKKRKPSPIILAFTCVIIVAVIIGVAVIVQQLSWKTGGKGTKSPYKWKEDGNEITLSFDTSKLGKGRWEVNGNDSGFFEINQASKNKRQFFYIKGKYKGSMILEISYIAQKDEEKIYNMMVELDVTDDGITVKRTSAKDYAAAQSEGDDTQNPFTYKVDEEGNLTLRITNIEESDWTYNEDEIPFYVEGPDIEDSVLKYVIKNSGVINEENITAESDIKQITPQKEGTKAILKISNERLGSYITMDLEVGKNNKIEVKSVKADGPSKEELAKIRENYKPAKIMTDEELEKLNEESGSQDVQ